jgi:hypothetical protein
MSERVVSPGQVYRHYKRNTLYEVICIATHTEAEEELVVYRDLQNDRCFARPSQIFLETIKFQESVIQRFKLEDNYGKQS